MFGRKKPRVSCEHCGKRVKARVAGNRLYPDDESWFVNGEGRIACSISCANKVMEGLGYGSGKVELIPNEELMSDTEALEGIYRGLPFETEAE